MWMPDVSSSKDSFLPLSEADGQLAGHGCSFHVQGTSEGSEEEKLWAADDLSGCSDQVGIPRTGMAPPALLRVLHVINGEHYAGAERVQDWLALRLPEFGVEVGFAAVKPGLFGAKRRAQQVPLYEAPMRSRLDIRPIWRLAQWVRQGGYQLIHAHTPRTLLVGTGAAWLAKVPLIYHVHSPAWADSTRRFSNWANATLERLLVRRAAGVICVSQALADQMVRRGLPKAKLAVVANGVPTAACHWTPKTPPRKPGSQSSCPLSRTASEPAPFPWTVGTVALFRPRKGIEILLEAIALLDRQDFPVRLRAVGPFEHPDYEAAMRQKVLDLGLAGRVEWTGPVEHVESELAQMDLFVLPSLFGEGLPMVLLEAMAVGVPIVATRIAGIEETIQDGRQGLLIPPGNPSALAQAIAFLLTHPEKALQLSQQARKRHALHYSDQAMASGVAAVYRRVLERHGSGRESALG